MLQKSTQVNVIFDDESADFIDQKCLDMGIKRTEYLRRLVYDAMDKERGGDDKTASDVEQLRQEMHSRLDDSWKEVVGSLLALTTLVAEGKDKNLGELRKESQAIALSLLEKTRA